MGALKDMIDHLTEQYTTSSSPAPPSIEEREPGAPCPVVLASDGTPLAWTPDPPHIRVYAWAIRTLRFVPVDAQTAKSLKITPGEMDEKRIQTLAVTLRMTEWEVQAGLDRLVREGDLMVKTERGRKTFWLAPLQYK